MGKTHTPHSRTPGGTRSRALRFGAPLTALALVAAVGAVQANAATGAASRSLIAVGALAAVPAGASVAKAPSSSTKINVEVALEPRNAAELQQYAELVSDPNSVFYRQYLTKQQAQLLFAPSSSEVAGVSAALKAAGLTPGAAIDDDMYVPITATIGQLESAFKVGFAGYRLKNGQSAFAATSVPKIAGDVAGEVRGLVGFDDFAKPTTSDTALGTAGKHMSATAASLADEANADAAGAGRDSAVPSMCGSLTSSIDAYLAQNGYVGKDGGTYYSPTALANVYGYADLLKSGDGGQGSTIAVEEWEAPDTQAISDYESCVGSHAKISYNTAQAGTPAQPTPTNLVGVESAIDIESASVVAPKASIIDYEGPDYNDTFTDADWLENFAAPVADDVANEISLSWLSYYYCEGTTYDATFEDSETTTLQLAAVQGQSFFAAAGDNGSEGCQLYPDTTADLSDPSNNPWITSLGGTYMQGLTNPSVAVWNDSFDTSATSGIGLLNYGGAGGGGESQWFSFDKSWNYQAGFVGPGYSNVCDAASGGACRQVPDLSALADWRSGFPLIYYADDTGYQVFMIGGTSLATPILAGMTALADSSPRCAANGPAGFVNPLLYDLAKNPQTYAANFDDETTGNNAYTPSGYTGDLYQAAKGYDMASGLGSPRAQNLIPALCMPNKWLIGGWVFGRSELGEAAQQGQASVDKAISSEAAEERAH